MIIRTGYVWTLPRRGLGQVPKLTGAQYAALTPAQQQAYGNNDPNFMSAASPASAPASSTAPNYPQTSPIAQQTLASLQSAVQNPVFATVPNQLGTTTTTFLLDSYMAQWAAGAIAFPSSLMGADPMSEAVAVAQSYCSQEAMPDCSNLSAIASKYGAQVAQALASEPALVQAVNQPGSIYSGSAAPGTTSSSQSTSVNAVSSPYYSPLVVNPSPPSQAVTDGSNVASTGSVSNVANGTSLTTTSGTTSTDIIPGVPNAVLFLGAGAAVLLLVVGMGGLK